MVVDLENRSAIN